MGKDKFKRGDVVRNCAGTCGTINSFGYERHGETAYDYINGGWDHESSMTLVHRDDEATLGEPKFKVGYRVQLVSLDQDHGTVRQIAGNKFKADWDNGWGNDNWFCLSDIRPSTKPKLGPAPWFVSQPAIVARYEHGQYLPSMNPRIHVTKEAATAEAERLAIANPGIEFGTFVLASKSVAKQPVAVTVLA